MAEAKGSNSKHSAADAGGAEGAPPVQFKNLWPIPALVLGGMLLVGGVTVALMGRPKPPADIPLEEAKALVQEKRYQEAVDWYTRGIRWYPFFKARPYADLAAAYLGLGKKPEALAAARQALGIDPNFASALRLVRMLESRPR